MFDDTGYLVICCRMSDVRCPMYFSFQTSCNVSTFSILHFQFSIHLRLPFGRTTVRHYIRTLSLSTRHSRLPATARYFFFLTFYNRFTRSCRFGFRCRCACSCFTPVFVDKSLIINKWLFIFIQTTVNSVII